MNHLKTHSNWLKPVFIVLFLLLLAGTGSILAAQSFRGSIRGEITDASGFAIPGAKIVARNLGTSESREITTDSAGEFRFLELPAGEYEVSAVAPGLQEVRAPRVRVMPRVRRGRWSRKSAC